MRRECSLYIVTSLAMFLLCPATLMCVRVARADELTEEYRGILERLRAERTKLSVEDRRQIALDLENSLLQHPESPVRTEVYLRASGLYLGGRQPEKAEGLLNKALTTEQFGPYDEMRIRTALGDVLFKSDSERALRQYEAAQVLANRLLHSGDLSSITASSDKKPPEQLLVDIYSTIILRLSDIWKQQEQPEKAATVLDNYAQEISSIATSFGKNSQNRMIHVAANTWLHAGRTLKKAGFAHSAHALYEEGLAVLDHTVSNSKIFEKVRFRLECEKAITSSAEPDRRLSSLRTLLEANENKSWLVNEAIRFSNTLDPLERYGLLSTLVSICGHKSESPELASLYENAGMAALRLGVINVAVKYFEEYIQRFPDGRCHKFLEAYIENLRERDSTYYVNLEDLFTAQIPDNSGTAESQKLTEKTKMFKTQKVTIQKAKVIQDEKKSKAIDLSLSKDRLILWCAVPVSVALLVCITLWYTQRMKQRCNLHKL